MKALLLSAALLFSASSSFGQISAKASASLVLDKPFKGANTIIITLPDSGLVAWKKAAAALTENGFTVKSSDKDLLTLSTEPKPVERAGELVIAATVKGTKMLLRGTAINPVITDTPSVIEYRGQKGSPALLAWQQLEAVAQSLGGAREYTRKK